MWIVRLALRRPYTVGVVSTLVFVLSALAISRMRVDIFPAIDIPVVLVVWNYPGLSAEDMERRVVIISERAYSTTVNGISRIESESIAGVGLLKVYFEPGADIGAAIAQITSVSLTASHFMPPGTQPPAIVQYDATNVAVAQLTVSSPTLSEQELFDYGLNFIRVRLFTIPGLSTPAPFGGKQREVMVDIDPAKVAAAGLSPQDVIDTVLQSNVIVPAGSARIGNFEYDVTLNGSPTTIAALNRLPIKTVAGRTVYLGDVGFAHDGYAVQENIVRVDGRRATYLAILKHADASTLAVIDATRKMLPLIEATAPKGLELKLDFDQSLFVRAAIASVLREGAIAALLVSLMILGFLGSWRSMLIVIASIPLAILTSVLGLFATGQTLNVMTLGGLALAVGMLVDDATVEIENINRNRAMGKPMLVAILDGARQVAVPAFAATLTISIVFFPVVLLTGPSRFLFTPLALAVVFAMLASYLLSRTLVPTLARLLLERHPLPGRAGEGPGAELARRPSLWSRANAWRDRSFERFRAFYGRELRRVLEHPAWAGAAALLLGAAAIPLAAVVGLDFFPQVDAGIMKLHFRAPVGTRIEATEELVDEAERHIRADVPARELATIDDDIGLPIFYNLAFVQTENVGGMDADILVQLRPGHHPTAGYEARIRDDLARSFPGSQAWFEPADIVSQVLNFGTAAPIDVQIEGNDLDRSYALALQIQSKLRQIPGTSDVRIPQILDYPALHVDVDRSRAIQIGLSEQQIANGLLVSLASSALVSPSFWLNPKNGVNYLVAAQTPLPQMASVDDLLATPLPTASQAPAPTPTSPTVAASSYLGSVATVRPQGTYALVNHYTVQRVVDVEAGVAGRDLGGTTLDIRRAIRSLGRLPTGVRIRVLGQSDSMFRAFGRLGLGLILAVLLVYLVLVVLFQSWLDPLIILVAVPGAMAGILWMLVLTGSTLNVESFMGAIMAVGIATSNSILLVSFANDFRAEHPAASPAEAALEAGKVRLRPVLITALAMILGMLPMALALGEGAEQNAPLGRAVIGGLLAATFVTLLLVPLAYTLLRRKPPRKHELDQRFAAEAGGR
ncbi:MAG TPA: efflux RND transporter permease subunit [Myxococcales bacterium]|nr:efflux RND transporter permease subunit [Myxococcales bacterium]